ncbi:MAG: Holliday junction branch migration protein RuvA [Bacteroidota bacterium]|jgi:Holliday junction DNA helicase RuvA
MISHLKGNVAACSATQIILEVNGIGYSLQISLNTYSAVQQLRECQLHTYLHITGGNQSPLMVYLFGFYEEAERDMFIHLLSITGVGANTVRLILSDLKPEEVQQAILSDNVGRFERIKGIGPKTAQRIILELKDKMAKTIISSKSDTITHNNIENEALNALILLGFNKTTAGAALQKALKQTGGELTVEALIKQSLRNL